MSTIERTRPQARKEFDPRKQDHGTAAERKGRMQKAYHREISDNAYFKLPYGLNGKPDNGPAFDEFAETLTYEKFDQLASEAEDNEDQDGEIYNSAVYLNLLYNRAAVIVDKLNELPLSATELMSQTELDSAKDHLEAELESIKEEIDFEEGFVGAPSYEQAGGRSDKAIRDSMARAATLDTFEDDDAGDYTGNSPIKIRNLKK